MAKKLLDKPWPWLAAAAALIALGLASFVLEEVAAGDPRPVGSAEDIVGLSDREDLNVLFILIDTLRADRLGAYGYERDTSPALDRLASEGVRFARHLSQSSWTKSSMASLWTGLYPARTGITRYDHVIPERALMPAEILRQAGFRTAGIYRNGWVAPTFGFEQGFEIYARPPASPQHRNARVENPTLEARGNDDDVIAAALEFLRIHGDERWFLYLHLMDLHEYTYDAESALFGSSQSDVYDNSIRWTDRTIEILLEYLNQWGLRDDTLIAIASDHGEAFRERGIEGHARAVYRETTEVPFLLSLPFRLDPGLVVAARTRNVDIWPTLLELVGADAPPDLDGVSLVPEMMAAARGETRPERMAISHLDQAWGQRNQPPRPTVAVAEGSHRYVRLLTSGDDVGERLFDSREDPLELTNRAAEETATLDHLREVAERYLESEPPWGEAPRREIGELELNQLRALGYEIP